MADDEECACRICRCGEDVGELYHPCRCEGSIAFVHEECLLSWLDHSKHTDCELCGEKFKFSTLYAPNTPRTPTIRDFLAWVLQGALAGVLPLAARGAMVVFCWALFVPYFTAIVTHILLYVENPAVVLQRAGTWSQVASDWFIGALLIGFVLLYICCMLSLTDCVFTDADEARHLQDALNVIQNNNNVQPAIVPPPLPEHPQPGGVEAAGDSGEDYTSDSEATDDSEAEPEPVVPGAGVEAVPVPAAAAAPIPEPLPEPAAPLDGDANNVDWDGAVVDANVVTLADFFGLTGPLQDLFVSFALGLVFVVGGIILFFCGPFVGQLAHLPWVYTGQPYEWTLPDPPTLNEPIIRSHDFVYILLGHLSFIAHTAAVAAVVHWCPIRGRRSAGMRIFIRWCKLTVFMTLRCLLQPVLVGAIVSVALTPLLGGTVARRIAFARQYPISAVVSCWAVGVTYILYSASILLQLRELMHPSIIASWVRPFDPHRSILRWTLEQTPTFVAVRSVMVQLFTIVTAVLFFALPTFCLAQMRGTWPEAGFAGYLGNVKAAMFESLDNRPHFHFTDPTAAVGTPDGALFSVHYWYPYMSVMVMGDAVAFHIAFAMALEALKIVAWVYEVAMLKVLCGMLGLRRVLLRDDVADEDREDDGLINAGDWGAPLPAEPDDSEEEEEEEELELAAAAAGGAGDGDEPAPAVALQDCPPLLPPMGPDAGDALDHVEAVLQWHRRRWMKRAPAGGAPPATPPPADAEVVPAAPKRPRLPTSALGWASLTARLAVFGASSWALSVIPLFHCFELCVMVGREIVSTGGIRMVAPLTNLVFHDPLIALVGMYVCLHVMHTVYIAFVGSVVMLASFLSTVSIASAKHITGVKGYVLRAAAVVGVAVCSPLWRSAAIVRDMGGLRVVKNAHQRAPQFMLALALAFLVLPVFLGYVVALSLDSVMVEAEVNAAWAASPRRQLLRFWLLGSFVSGTVYDLSALGLFGATCQRLMDTIDLKLMECRTRHVLKRVILPATGLLTVLVATLWLSFSVLRPAGDLLPVPSPELTVNASASSALPVYQHELTKVFNMWPLSQVSISTPLPEAFGSLAHLPLEIMAHPTHMFSCRFLGGVSDACYRWLELSASMSRTCAVLATAGAWVLLSHRSGGGARASFRSRVRQAWRLVQRRVKDERYKVGRRLRNVRRRAPSTQ